MPDRIPISGGKAATLMRLASRLQSARIPVCSVLSLEDWRADPESAIARVLGEIRADSLAVRSARRDEDRSPANAGRYLSLLDVAAEHAALANAVRRVFDSYDALCADDQILVQPQITGITHSIVASTRGAFGSAYDSVSYAQGDSPDAITRGDSPADTWHLADDVNAENLPAPVARALAVLEELRSTLETAAFEVELLEAGETLWLLQVRPLPGDPRIASIERTIQQASSQLDEARADGTALLGLMPDWNPAELLGIHPRPFTLSLFQSVIGETSWWQAREDLGYARPYSSQLIRPIAGRPYVDVRASFESLCPAELSARERQRLVVAWLEQLRARPQLHDRVEFDIVLGGFEFDAAHKLARLDCAIADSSVLPALRRLTTQALDRTELRRAIERFGCLLAEPAVGRTSLRERLHFIQHDVARLFARVARCDFLAQALWRSAVRRGAIAPQRCLDILSTMDEAFGQNEIAAGRESRPGQFDIRSVERISRTRRTCLPQHGRTQHLGREETRTIAELLIESSLPWSPEQLIDLSQLAARGRELGKRALAALLGDWLAQVRAFAESRHLDSEMLSWLPWQLAIDPNASTSAFIERSMQAMHRHAEEAQLMMPMLLENPNDLRAVHLPAASGHFHGHGTIESAVILLDQGSHPEMLPPRSIVAIHSADPGYEWIFSRQPLALITAYGGPHSHMALRCADARCGAVLGLGAARFAKLVAAKTLHIDFDHSQIRNISGIDFETDKQVA